MTDTKKRTRRYLPAQPDPMDELRAAVKAIPKLSTIPTNEEIARAFNALKLALEK